MSWLDASEFYVMDAAVRDRIEDLRTSADLALASTDGTGHTMVGETEPERLRRRCESLEICRGQRPPQHLQTPSLARS
jgi:hypothetical protein